MSSWIRYHCRWKEKEPKETKCEGYGEDGGDDIRFRFVFHGEVFGMEVEMSGYTTSAIGLARLAVWKGDDYGDVDVIAVD